jgi:prepilin-type N-terminal cleavage/methylation domain-containing protein
MTSLFQNKKGMTLFEIMIVIAILAVVGAGIFMTFTAGHSSWMGADARIILQQNLRWAMRSITDDLRQSSSTQISIPANGTIFNSLSFNISQGITATGVINWTSSEISYALSGNQVIRTYGAQTKVVGNHISQIEVSRQPSSPDVVLINITAQKMDNYNRTQTASLESAASMRN